MFSRPRNKKAGFTLIELLVVVAIISLLSSVVLSSLNSARSKARDAKRKSDLKQVQVALELYYNANGTYVVAGTGNGGSGAGWLNYVGGVYTKSVVRGLWEAGFLSAASVDDPQQIPGFMIYHCSSTKYSLFATLENPTASDLALATSACSGAVVGPGTAYNKTYAITNS